MISSLKIEIGQPEEMYLNTNMASLFHGYIMENVDRSFAEEMHMSEIRPFSQSLIRTRDGKWFWRVNTLTDRAYEEIINMLISKKSIYIKHKDLTLDILNYELKKTDFNKLFEDNYINSNSKRYIEIEFVTPTAFKSNSKYINYPDLGLFFKSIISKYDKNSKSTKIYDDELIEQLSVGTEIVKYNLRSTHFSVEGVRIPSFVGKITIKVKGNSTTVNLVNMLAEFAEYSGVGIKNALGMGGLIKRN